MVSAAGACLSQHAVEYMTSFVINMCTCMQGNQRAEEAEQAAAQADERASQAEQQLTTAAARAQAELMAADSR